MVNLKRNLSFFIIFFLSTVLNGCAPSESANKNSTDIVVWHWMSDRDEAFQELARRYEAETGTKVKFELYAPSVAYEQKVKASVQTNTLPDVYGVLGEKRDFASFISAGFVADLTPALSAQGEGGAWKDQLFDRALAVSEFKEGNEFSVKPGVYGVPLDVMTIQFVYNKDLFKQAGLDPEKPPATWEEFIADCRALRENNIPRFVSGFGEIWMIDALASNIAMNVMGEEKYFDTLRGKVPYTDPDWIKVFTVFKQMADEKILVDGAVTMVNKSAEQTFANSRAAFAYNGSWCVNVYKGMNPGLNYGAMLPPKVTSQNPMLVWGGAGSSFVVNDRSPRRDAAIAFLKWLTLDKQQAYLATQTENLPSNKASLTQITPILSQFADDMDNITHPNVYPVHEIPAVTEAFDKGIQSILIGDRSPEETAAEVQRLKEKESKKANL